MTDTELEEFTAFAGQLADTSREDQPGQRFIHQSALSMCMNGKTISTTNGR